ncbi:MAG: 2-oxo-4-hydroxy-4-carboxy-5-ureidoimidazoline decarboxylase [Reyranellaceae bacterium]
MATLTIQALNGLPAGEFRDILSGVFERSPWVAEAVESGRPFADLTALHRAMTAAVTAAPREAKLALLRAHPDLAGKEAQEGALTEDSTREQKSAGLDRLTRQQMQTIARNNEAYKARFGFPFIICVRNHDRGGIFAAFERRLGNTAEAEFETALREVHEIARLRLETLLR